MKAQFKANCRGCRKPIRPGDEIHYDDAGSRHVGCRDKKGKRAQMWQKRIARSMRIFTLDDDILTGTTPVMLQCVMEG